MSAPAAPPKAPRGACAIDAAAPHATPEDSRPLPERILRGDPIQRIWNEYSDRNGRFHAGIWQGEAGAWRVLYGAGEEEFCVLLEGRVRLQADGGPVQEFGPGSAFVVPAGFSGVWENLTRVRKYYAVADTRAGSQILTP